MAAESESYNGLMHAGGTGLFLLALSAMIPGLLPFIALYMPRAGAGARRLDRDPREVAAESAW
jgi:hypothetical protein